ncbi:hypothetical protein [Desulfoplanes formicivorans]|uniref:Uncharacterized protein n=1 Tax=Desulfoplanes formicivorans TaxID=1592317 RepID=A0A194ADG1_9BACT|nr:hypothetical protein [Desulfoplanes formicivorans]GAU08127.1 hypothetical protein DPF_0830 [Desulfoplanes formicivorans]
MDIINWIIENWVGILTAATSVVTAASLITKLTDTPADDAFVAKVYKVIEALALVTGKAKQQPGETSATSTTKTSVLFLPMLFSVVMLVSIACGCSANMTPRERAQSTGYEVGQAYQELYANYVATEERLQAAGETMPAELAKSMDALKRAIIAYNDMVIVWAGTNAIDTPEGLDSLGADIAQLISDISTTLMSLSLQGE